MASPVPEESYGYEESRFEKDVDKNFHCSICYNVLKDPRMCRNNEHIFCLACITRSLNVTSQTCPECSEHLSVDTLRQAPRVLNNYLSDLQIKCEYASRGCPAFVRLESLNTHIENCGFAPVLCSNEECLMEINKQDKAHHESAICEYRKLKCHNCGQIQESLTRLEGTLVEMNKKINQNEDALKKSMKQDFKKLEVLKKEVKCVKDKVTTVNKDVVELKVMMGQILETFNKVELMGDKLPSTSEKNLKTARKKIFGRDIRHGSLSMQSAICPTHLRQPALRPTAVMARNNLLANDNICNGIVIPGQDVLNPSLLAQASAGDQKQMLGEHLFPLIQQTHPDLAGKITGMLLEIDNAELLHMLEFRDALAAKVEEAMSVLRAHEEREQGQETGT